MDIIESLIALKKARQQQIELVDQQLDQNLSDDDNINLATHIDGLTQRIIEQVDNMFGLKGAQNADGLTATNIRANRMRRIMKLWLVRFYKQAKVLVFAFDIDNAKIEARQLRPDLTNKSIVEVRRLDWSGQMPEHNCSDIECSWNEDGDCTFPQTNEDSRVCPEHEDDEYLQTNH